MGGSRKPQSLTWRPAYHITFASPGWRVRRRGVRETLALFPRREEAIAFAESQVSKHVVVQIVIYAEVGFEREYAHFNPAAVAEAEAILERRLAPYRDEKAARAVSDPRYSENCDIVINGETVRMTVSLHEGSMWDEVYVHGAIWDEFIGERIAEINFTHIN